MVVVWWRRGESNPRPKTLQRGYLHAYPPKPLSGVVQDGKDDRCNGHASHFIFDAGLVWATTDL